MKKIFTFDMDGTILDDNDKIKSETVLAIKELNNQGHMAVIATGRPYADVIRSLKNDIDLFKYIICNNGSYYIDQATKDVVSFPAIPNNLITEAIKIGKEHDCFIAIHGNESAQRTFLGEVANIDWESKEFAEFDKFKNEFIDINEILEWAKTQTVFQCSLRSDVKTINKIKPMFDKYGNDVDIHIANTVYLDINPKGASKLAGLEKLATNVGSTIDNIIAFGDSGNDLQMLEGVGLGICMSNGSSDAKAAANEVIGDNNSDAIGKKIMEILNV